MFTRILSLLTALRADVALARVDMDAMLANAAQAVRDGDVGMADSYTRMARGFISAAADTRDAAQAQKLIARAVLYRKVARGDYGRPYSGPFSVERAD